MFDDSESVATDVLIERRDKTVVARLNRPEHGGSIHGTLMRDLLRAAETADADDDVRAIVTIGEGSTYCVGADRDVFTRFGAEGAIDLHELGFQGEVGGDWGLARLSAGQKRADSLGLGQWVNRFLNVGTPTIAAINGERPAAAWRSRSCTTSGSHRIARSSLRRSSHWGFHPSWG